jgi:cytochrome c556
MRGGGVKRRKSHCVWQFAGLVILLLVGAFLVSSLFAKEERNLAREEMAELDLAFKGIIDAVVLGDMSLIPPALGKAQEAHEKRDDALKAGFPIRLPKNPNRRDEFIFLDQKFQIDLLELGRAAETGQRRAVRNQAHKLLDACVGCHEKFRR